MVSSFIIYIFLTLSTSNCISADTNLRLAFTAFGKLTNQFLFTIQPFDGLNLSIGLLPQILGKVPPSNDTMFYVNYLWQTYVGYFILIIIGVAFIVLFTIVGLCYCCCRCCCKRCGAKPPGPSDTNTKKKRIILNVLLFLLSSMILIGCIVAMVSNAVLFDVLKTQNTTNDKAGNLFANVDLLVQGANSYINYIANNAQTNGYKVLQSTLANIGSALSSNVALFINTFLAQLNYQPILNATDTLVTNYTLANVASSSLASTSAFHQSNTTDFQQFLNNFVQNMTNILNQPQCQNYTENCNQVTQLLKSITLGYNTSNINYTFDQNTINVMNSYNISNLVTAKNTFVANAVNVTNQINSTVSGYVTTFANNLNSNSSILTTYNTTILFKNALIDAITTIVNTVYSYKLINGLSINDGLISTYYTYIFYSLVALITIILLVGFLFYIGLCYGTCGGPNFEDSSSCSKGAGSGFLMGSVALSFIFGWLIMLIVMSMFLVGGVAQTEGCSYFTGNYSSKPLSTFDNIINASLTTLNISFNLNGATIGLPNINYVQSLFNRCPSSTDLMSAFQVPSLYISGLSVAIYQQLIQPYLIKLVQQIRDYQVPSIDTGDLSNGLRQINTIIGSLNDPNNAKEIAELQKFVLTLPDVGGFSTSVNDLVTISNLSYPDWAKSLATTLSTLSPRVSSMSVLHKLYLQQKNAFTTALVTMNAQSQILSNNINSLPSKASDAVSTAVAMTNSTLGQNSSSIINQTIFNMVNSLGNCQGLASLANQAITMLCANLVGPFNNLWLGMGWFLLFIIPAIIVALKLHRLYQISHIEDRSTQYGKAYQSTNHFLSEGDMEKIRSRRFESSA